MHVVSLASISMVRSKVNEILLVVKMLSMPLVV